MLCAVGCGTGSPNGGSNATTSSTASDTASAPAVTPSGSVTPPTTDAPTMPTSAPTASSSDDLTIDDSSGATAATGPAEDSTSDVVTETAPEVTEFAPVGCTEVLARASTSTMTQVSDTVWDYTLDGAPAENHYRVAILMYDGQTVAPVDDFGWLRTEYTPLDVGNAFFNDPDGVAHFLAEASYGKVSLEGRVVGWIDLGSYTEPADQFVLNAETFAEMAADRVDFTQYDITFLVAITDVEDQIQMGWGMENSLLGVFPMGIDFMINSYFWNESGLRGHSSTALPSTSWSHELSHTLGMVGHDIALDCGSAIVSPECVIQAYGNPYSIMGAYIYGTHHSIEGKQALTFLTESQVQGVTTDGVYGVCPLETADGQVKGLSVPLPTPLTILASDDTEVIFDRLLVEYRTPRGFDRYLDRLTTDFVLEFFPDGPLDSDGVTLSLGYANETDSSVLLDAHPETYFTQSGIKVAGDGGKYADARLRRGETADLDLVGLHVTYEGNSADGAAHVRIEGL